MASGEGSLISRDTVEKHDLSSDHRTIFLASWSFQKLVDHHQKVILLDHVVVDIFEGRVSVVHIDENIVE